MRGTLSQLLRHHCLDWRNVNEAEAEDKDIFSACSNVASLCRQDNEQLAWPFV